MKKRFGAVLWTVAFVATSSVLAGGCVSLDKYRQLELAQRNCEAERERLVGDLANAKVQARDLQARADGLDATVKNRNQQIGLLEGQVRTAQNALAKMTEIYKDLAARPIPTGQPIIALPPELDTALKDFAEKYPDMVQYDSRRGVLKFGSERQDLRNWRA